MSSPACSNGSSGTIVEEDENEEMMSGDSMAGSKKSVRFNEVVLRQVYRSNSSILGQKHKNQKKAEQKRRKAGRRASEGDKPDSDSKTSFSPDESEDCYQDQDQDHTNDSGMASSMDESSGSVDLTGNGNKNKKKTTVGKNSSKPNGESKMKNKRSKVASRFMDESHGHSDLIFNLDFY
jgi:dynein assembly factor 2